MFGLIALLVELPHIECTHFLQALRCHMTPVIILQDFLLLQIYQVVLTLYMLLRNLFEFLNLIVEIRCQRSHWRLLSVRLVEVVVEGASAHAVFRLNWLFLDGFGLILKGSAFFILINNNGGGIGPRLALQILGNVRIPVPFLDLFVSEVNQLIRFISQAYVFQVVLLNLTFLLYMF